MSDKGSGTVSGGNGLLIAGAVIVVLIGAGVYLSTWQSGQLSDEDVTALVTPDSPPQVVTPSTNTDSQTEEAAQPEAETAQADPNPVAQDNVPPKVASDPAPATNLVVVPSVDEVRVDADGLLVVAGRAAPGASVDVLVDGEVAASGVADSSGAFAAVGSVPAGDGARTLTLRAGEGAAVVVSAEEIILAPVTAPRRAQTEMQIAEGAPVPVQPQDTEGTEETAAAPAQETTAEGAAPAGQTPTEGSATVVAEATGTTSEGRAADATIADATAAGEAQDAPRVTETTIDGAADTGTETSGQDVETPEAEDAAAPPQEPQIAVLKSDAEGVSLMQTAPTPPASVVLDTISYSDDGVVQLGGRASGKAVEVRAYLNNSSVARLPVDDKGDWRGDVPDVAAGVYTLRVDAVASDGTVVSRLETPFKREAPAVLAAAAEGADGPVRAVTVQTGDTLWAIARDRYGDGVLYVQVFEANRDAIRNPDLIYPGQVFDLPGE